MEFCTQINIELPDTFTTEALDLFNGTVNANTTQLTVNHALSSVATTGRLTAQNSGILLLTYYTINYTCFLKFMDLATSTSNDDATQTKMETNRSGALAVQIFNIALSLTTKTSIKSSAICKLTTSL